MPVKKADLAIMRTQCAGLLAFAQNAQANLRRLSVEDRVALDKALAAHKRGDAYDIADTLRVLVKVSKALYEASKEAADESTN